MKQEYIKVGVLGKSTKKEEYRIPIFPNHIDRIDPKLLQNLYFEEDYGMRFAVTDLEIRDMGANILSRNEIFAQCDLLLICKVTVRDLMQARNGQIVCGWMHTTQQFEIAQIAIDKQLTLIAWENMYKEDPHNRNNKSIYIFNRNRELAGYAGIIHLLGLLGIDGYYGQRRKVSVLGFGAVSRGIIYALQGRGFNNIHVYTRRDPHLIENRNPNCYYHQIIMKNNAWHSFNIEGVENCLIAELAESDIICNAVYQDVCNPTMFITKESELDMLNPGTAIIDVSCDKGMGFYFATPTTLDKPTIQVSPKVLYYAVDHTPSYLWNAASREISLALLPLLPILMKGSSGWETSKTIMNSIDVLNGTILNTNTLLFQNRDPNYPHKIR